MKRGGKFPKPGLPEILIEKPLVKYKAVNASKFVYVYGKAGSGKTVFVLSTFCKNSIYIKIPKSKMDDIAFIYSYFLISDLNFENKALNEGIYDLKRNEILRNIVINVAKNKKRLTIIIDDLHNLSGKRKVSVFLKELFHYAPDNMFFAFTSRFAPPAFLLAESDRGVFINSDSLNFSVREISRLAQNMGISDSEILSKRIYKITKGWPLGSVLLLRSYKENGNLAKDYVFSYLAEEILKKQKKSLRSFMLKTSIMPILDTSIANEYLGIENSAEILGVLMKENLFLQKLGNHRYVYHELFREFLLKKFKESVSFDAFVKNLARIYLERSEFGLALSLFSNVNDFKGLEFILKNSSESEVVKYADGIISLTGMVKKRNKQLHPIMKLVRAEALYVKNEMRKALVLLENEESYRKADLFLRYLYVKMKVLNALGMYSKVVELFKKSKIDVEEDRTEIGIGILYEIAKAEFFNSGEKRASEILSKLYDNIDMIKNTGLLIKILHAYCIVNYHDKGLYEEAKDLYEKIIAISEENAMLVDPMFLTNLSFCENDLGEKAKAFIHVKRAIKIAKTLKWGSRISSSEVAMGHYFLTVDKFDKAISVFKKYIDARDPFIRSSALFGMAEALRKKGMFERAMYYEIKDLEISGRTKNTLLVAQSLFQLGIIEFCMGNKNSAKSHFEESLKYAMKSKNIYEIARTEILLAALLERLGKNYEKYFKQAKRIIIKNKFYHIIFSEKFFLYPFLKRIGEENFLKTVVSLFGETDFFIRTLGQFKIYCSGIDITKRIFKREKERKIFQFMLAKYPEHVSPDVLIDVFYRNMEFEKAKHNLSVILSGIKKGLEEFCGRKIIIRTPEGYGLDITESQADFLLFNKFSEEGLTGKEKKKLKKALKLYKGDFLPETIYDDWSAIRRERLYGICIDTLFAISALVSDAQKIKYLKRVMEKDKVNEEAAYGLMKCYLKLGKRNESLLVYKKFEERLLSDYGIKPGERLRSLYREILLK